MTEPTKSALRTKTWRDRKRAKVSRLIEIAAAMSDAEIEVQIETLRSAIQKASTPHLERGLERELDDWLDIRLARDCEKMLEAHSKEWDEMYRPAFDKGARFPLRPRRVPAIGDSICPYTKKPL